MQSNLQEHVRERSEDRLHVAIIMDGNGRWAAARGLPREAGHHAGIATLRAITEAAARDPRIATLTVYAFSVDNWRRPEAEVATLMAILASYLERELAGLVRAGVRLDVIGRRDRLASRIVDLIGHAESVTAQGEALNLKVAIDYSSRDAILDAVSAASGSASGLSRQSLSQCLAEGAGGPDVDLLIRTSGEQRLSDFLLWEAAYAELYFTATPWPDFEPEDLSFALAEFAARDRRYGGLSAPRPALPEVSSVAPVTQPPAQQRTVFDRARSLIPSITW